MAGAFEDLWRPHPQSVHLDDALSALAPLISRRDAWPPTGGPPGSDLAFMQKQHLDPYNVEFGLLQVLDLGIASQVNLEFGAALQHAINEWQYEFSRPDPRLKASIIVGRTTGRRGGGDRALRSARATRRR